MYYVIALLLLMTSWLQPMHILPWVSWHSEILVFVAMIFLAFGAFSERVQNNRYVAIPQVVWLFIALLMIVAVQTAMGLIGFVGDAFVISAYLMICTVGLTIGHFLQHGLHTTNGSIISIENILARFAVACLLVASVSAWVCLAQALDVWMNGGWFERAANLRRPGANLGQANQLGTLLVMGLACLAFLHASGKLSAIGSSALYFLLALGLAATASRSGLLSFILLAIWWNLGSTGHWCKATRWVSVFAIFVLGVLVAYWPSVVVAVQEGAWGLDLDKNHINVSGQARLTIWEQLLSAVWQRPWFGWGLREVAAAHNAVVDGFAQSAPFTYAHSIVLDLAIGVGLPLAATFTSLSALWLFKRIRQAKSKTVWFCLAFMLPFVVHSQFEFPFAYSYFLMPVCIAIGIIEASVNAPVFRMNRKLAGTFLAAFTVMVGWSAYEYSVLEEDFRVARFEALRIGTTPSEYEKPKIHLLTQLGALVWASRLAPNVEMSEQDIETLRKVALHFPWTATQNRYALALALNGNPHEAIRQLRVMRSMHGSRTHELLMENWVELSNTKFPQLKSMQIPTENSEK
jgi:O-antigen ligase